MECAICFDEIGAARATLGCSHSFHINCIVSWYYRQNMACDLEREEYEAGKTASSCPCCRAAPAAKLDDIPNEHLINFVPAAEDDDSASLSSDSEGGPEDEELAAASPRTPRPVTATPVPPLDLSTLQLRWTRTGSTSWAAAILENLEEVAAAAPAAATAEPLAWDAERTPSPPPDSLVSQVTEAARKIQTAWRALRAPSPLEFV
jgi:hypothetical protein